MAIRKYTKKRRRRSLRKLRGGTRTPEEPTPEEPTPEEPTPEESTPLSPRQFDLAEVEAALAGLVSRVELEDVLSRKQALRVHDNLFRNLHSLQSYHNPEQARYATRTASPPPMTPRKRQELAEYLAMRRAPPHERRELFMAMLERRARRFAQNRRKKPGLFNELEEHRGLVDRHVDLYFRDLARQLDDAILNLRPTKSPQRRSASRSTRRRSATLSPPPSARSASRTAWGGRGRTRRKR